MEASPEQVVNPVRKKVNKGKKKPLKGETKQNQEDLLQRRAELEAKLHKRRDCEKRSHQIVVKMLEENVSEEFLIDAAKYLDLSYYSDITEERSIIKLCGYPICQNQLKNVPKQKYHISVKTNTVYDITDRKKFCGGFCFRASAFYGQQLATSPVWARENETPAPVTLLAADKRKPGIGEPVLVDPRLEIQQEVKSLEEHDQRFSKKTVETSCKKSQQDSVAKSSVNSVKNVTAGIEHLNIENPNIDSDMDTIKERGSVLIGNTKKDSKGLSETEKLTYLLNALDRREQLLAEKNKLLEGSNASANNAISLSNSDSLDQNQVNDDCMQNNDHQNSSNSKQTVIKQETVSGNSNNIPCKDKTKNESSSTGLIKDNLVVGAITEKNVNLEQSGTKPALRSCFIEDYGGVVDSPVGKHVNISSSSVLENIKKLGTNSPNVRTPEVTLVYLVQNVFSQWKSEQTVEFFKKDSTGGDTDDFAAKYAALGRNVDKYVQNIGDILGEDGLKEDDDEKPKQPLPNYEELKKQTKEFELKVKEFYKGKEWKGVVEEEESALVKTENSEGEKKKEREIRLPHVDSLQQLAIRRKIVLDRINKILPELLGPLGVPVREVGGHLRDLVGTFNLTSMNISLKPAEWSIITYVLLRMLAVKLPVLQEAFSQKSVSFITTMMSRLGITEHKVQDIVLSTTTVQQQQQQQQHQQQTLDEDDDLDLD